METNTDEHPLPINDFKSSFVGNDSKSCVRCPHCHKNIDSVVEKLAEEIKSWASSNSDSKKVEDARLSVKVKTHYFPAKKSFISESLNNSRVAESLNDLRVIHDTNRALISQRAIVETQRKTDEMQRLLYEVRK